MMTHGSTASRILAATAGLLLMLGCSNSDVERASQSQGEGRMPGNGMAAATANSAAGVQWTVPEGWQTGPLRAMRVATYLVGDGDAIAECAVFFFGAGQGGSIEDNIDRWIGQFKQPDGSDSKSKATTGERKVAGLTVTTVNLTGTYNAGMGAPMGAQESAQDGYRLLGAIISAPQGPVFFKMTGPADVVAAAAPAFDQLIASVDKL